MVGQTICLTIFSDYKELLSEIAYRSWLEAIKLSPHNVLATPVNTIGLLQKNVRVEEHC